MDGFYTRTLKRWSRRSALNLNFNLNLAINKKRIDPMGLTLVTATGALA